MRSGLNETKSKTQVTTIKRRESKLDSRHLLEIDLLSSWAVLEWGPYACRTRRTRVG
jgi:hypothetical protein